MVSEYKLGDKFLELKICNFFIIALNEGKKYSFYLLVERIIIIMKASAYKLLN